MSDVTQLLTALQQGQAQAAEELLPLVYDELRKLARAKLRHEPPGQTLEATALVHEAWLRVAGGIQNSECRIQNAECQIQESASSDLRPPTTDLRPPAPDLWDSRGHFFAAAAEAMRRILVESARRKSRLKRGGDVQHEPLDDEAIIAPMIDADLLALDAALDQLAAKDPRKAELVKLRYFAGLTQQQAAEVLGVGVSTADRDWAYARAWLYREISK